MRVLFIIPHPEEAASGRCRVLQYLPWLTRQGVHCEVRPFMSPALYRLLYQPGRFPHKVAMSTAALLRRGADLVRSARADVVVVHREALPLGTALLERLMARLCPALIFDFDDAIYLNHSSAANAWARAFRRPQKIARIIALSSHVIAGNRILEAYARTHNPHVSVVPTPVDTDRFTVRRAPRDPNRLIIGWIGSHTTASYLNELRRPLELIARRYPHVEIRMVGAGQPPLTLPNLRVAQWALSRELEELQGFDIGLMPMPDNEWTRGKCGFKALLYMSVGIPVVASPVGVNREIVQEGLNGFLASTEASWTERLSQLIEDRALRDRMGQVGRAIVETDYSVHVQAPRVLDILQRIHREHRGHA